jgi:hypothetical protein
MDELNYINYGIAESLLLAARSGDTPSNTRLAECACNIECSHRMRSFLLAEPCFEEAGVTGSEFDRICQCGAQLKPPLKIQALFIGGLDIRSRAPTLSALPAWPP